MKKREYALLIGPSLLVMFGFLAVPVYRTLVWSFQDVNYGTPGRWVGLDNYSRALTDPRFGEAVLFTVGLAAVSVVLTLILGYILANMINRLGRARPLVLGIMLISYVIPHVVGATAFSWLFDTNFGGVANLLFSNLFGTEVLWFTDVWPNRLIILLNVMWSTLPFAMLMILAGLQGVPEETLEAAQIDGAGTLSVHWHVIIPTIRGVMVFVSLIMIMDKLRVMDNLIPLSPQATSIGNESIMLYVFHIAFTDGSPQLGLGSAINVLTIILILIALWPSVRGILKEARHG
ncbi:sugar ABC transporter permease [Naumannella sp. ID2617S]|nr:sugar ABC transporter permease [Naumannella sp. ID2617S]